MSRVAIATLIHTSCFISQPDSTAACKLEQSSMRLGGLASCSRSSASSSDLPTRWHLPSINLYVWPQSCKDSAVPRIPAAMSAIASSLSGIAHLIFS